MRNYSTSLPKNLTNDIKAGKVLAGDDYSEDQIAQWFDEEQEAYFINDSGESKNDLWYDYMRFVNEKLGFSIIKSDKIVEGSIVLLGPGPGYEIENFAIKNPTWRLTFIEPSDNFKEQLKENYPNARVLHPSASGIINLQDNTVDVFCAFGVLHHIPNVTTILQEAYRVLKPGGVLITREPCSSMGDWRTTRSATPNERGIPKNLFLRMATNSGFKALKHPIPIFFEPLNKLLKKTIGFKFISFKLLFRLDLLISRTVAINDYYWRDNWFKKIGPSSYFYRFQK